MVTFLKTIFVYKRLCWVCSVGLSVFTVFWAVLSEIYVEIPHMKIVTGKGNRGGVYEKISGKVAHLFHFWTDSSKNWAPDSSWIMLYGKINIFEKSSFFRVFFEVGKNVGQHFLKLKFDQHFFWARKKIEKVKIFQKLQFSHIIWSMNCQELNF